MNILRKIDIDIHDILTQVAMTSEYMAVKNERAVENYERLAVMEVDEPLLSSAITMAYHQLCEILQPYILPHLALETPHHYSLCVRPDVAVSENTVRLWQIQAHELMKAAILTEWLRIVAPEIANQWYHRAEEIRQQFIVSLTPRLRKPRKRMEVV